MRSAVSGRQAWLAAVGRGQAFIEDDVEWRLFCRSSTGGGSLGFSCFSLVCSRFCWVCSLVWLYSVICSFCSVLCNICFLFSSCILQVGVGGRRGREKGLVCGWQLSGGRVGRREEGELVGCGGWIYLSFSGVGVLFFVFEFTLQLSDYFLSVKYRFGGYSQFIGYRGQFVFKGRVMLESCFLDVFLKS